MANRTLDQKEVGKLLAISNKQADAIDARRRWPGRENIKTLAQAVKDRRPFVFIADKRYKIRYTTHFGGTVFVSPDGWALIPCGYFSIEKLENALTLPEGLEDEE